MVYASQHGEIVRTTEMLEQLAAQEALSPTAFSMSVLNASIGLYSIIRGITAPATAVAASDETLGYALLETHIQLRADPERPLLLVYADEAIPTIWEAPSNAAPHALGLLFDPAAATRIECQYATAENDTGEASAGTQARSLARCLHTDADARWHNRQHQWHWRKLAA